MTKRLPPTSRRHPSQPHTRWSTASRRCVGRFFGSLGPSPKPTTRSQRATVFAVASAVGDAEEAGFGGTGELRGPCAVAEDVQ